jgi:hypothetical protein
MRLGVQTWNVWATTRSASGKPGSVASVLECSDITAPDAPTIAKLRLQFDEQEWQVSVDLFRSPSTPEALVELLLREQYQWLPPRSNGPARVERH